MLKSSNNLPEAKKPSSKQKKAPHRGAKYLLANKEENKT